MVRPGQDPTAPLGDKTPQVSADHLADVGQRAGLAMIWQAMLHGSEKLIDLARLLILAAILTPEDFGLLAVSLVAVRVFAGLTEMGVTLALIQRRSAEAVHYDTAWTFGVLRGLVVAVLVAAAAPWIADFLREPRAVDIIRVLGLSPLLQSLASMGIADLTRNLRFRPLTILRLSGSLAGALIAVGLAPNFGVWALVAGALVGPSVFSLFSYVIAPYRPRLRLDWTAGRSLIRFGQWIFVTGLIAMAGHAVLQAVISRRLGTVDLGLYFLAFKLTFVLSDVGQQVISNVAFPLYARLQGSPHEVARVNRSILVAMSILLLPPFAILIALAPAVPEVLGAKWTGVAPLIQILSVAAMIGLYADTAVPLFQGLGRPSRVSILEAAQSSILILGVLALTGPFGLIGAVSSWVLALFASLLIALAFVSRLIRKPYEGITGLLAAIACATIAGGLLAYGLHGVLPGVAGAIAAGLISISAAWGGLWLSDGKWGLGLRVSITLLFPRLGVEDPG
jgi:PST family polysaccharide transporter/lipopolysaccharide exporter